MCSSFNPRDPELPVILPSLRAKDCSELAVVRFITLIQPHRPVVEINTRLLGEGGAILQFPQHPGVQWRGSLGSLEGTGKTRRRPEEIGMIESCAQSDDGAVSRAADPARPGRIQKAELRCQLPNNGGRINTGRISADRGNDHLGQDSIAMQPCNMLPGIKRLFHPFTQDKQQWKAPRGHAPVVFRSADSQGQSPLITGLNFVLHPRAVARQ